MHMHEIDVASLGVGQRYGLMVGAIVPRPIAFVSSVSGEGRHNIAPYSFFNGVGANPMLLMFCPANGADGTEKDSLRNALPDAEGGTGGFCVNIASEGIRREVAAAGEELPHGESEFDLTRLTPVPAAKITAPRAAESPFGFECETERVIRFAPGQPGGANLVIGRVVHVWAAEGVIDDRGMVDADRLAAIGRMGGAAYVRTRERFDLPRGQAAMTWSAPLPGDPADRVPVQRHDPASE
jgi:flavin reductase (DIM6/NTAB) family NADH-FMN oxidoreductase RutF